MKREIEIGKETFTFDGFQHWLDAPSTIVVDILDSEVICIDARGRICANGEDFMAAVYPVRVYELAPE